MESIRVRSVTKRKYKKNVYDIVGIPDNHNFVANRMVVHNCDEAIKFAAAQNHNKAESKQLKEIFAVIRPRRLMFLMCIPEFTWLDSKYREGMSSFWLRLINRGEAVLFEKDKGIADDHYHVKKLQKLMGSVFHYTDVRKLKSKLTKHPCFSSLIQVPTLSDAVYNNYETVRNALTLQRQIEEATLSNKDMAKMVAWNVMNNWDNIRLQVQKSKSNRMTYQILINNVFRNPITTKSLISEPTARNYIKAVDDYVASKGIEVGGFDGSKETILQTKSGEKPKLRTLTIENESELIKMHPKDVGDNEIIEL